MDSPWLFLASLIVCAVGMVALLRARRGRRFGDHPHCRRCEFDLFGLPAGHARCPECGADLTQKRARIIGERRARPVLLACSVLTILAAIGGGSFVVRDLSKSQRWKPLWLLERQAQAGGNQQRWVEVFEILRRIDARELSDSQLQHLVFAPIDGASPALWSPAIESFVRLNDRRKISDDDLEKLCRHIAEQTCRLQIRQKIRRGDDLAMLLNCAWPPAGDRTEVDVSLSSNAIKIGQVSWKLTELRTGIRNIPDWAVQGGGGGEVTVKVPLSAWDALQVGEQHVEVTLHATVQMARANFRPAKWEGALTLSVPLRIVDPDNEIVQLTLDPELRDQMWKCFRPGIHPSSAEYFLMLGDNARPPFEYAFDVIARSSKGETKLGSFHTQSYWSPLPYTVVRAPENFHEDQFDVVLRPSQDEAARSIDLVKIWGEEIVYNDVRPYTRATDPKARAEAP